MQSCNSFPSCGQLLPRIRMSFVHNYSMTRARILGNNWPRYRKILQDCIKLLFNVYPTAVSHSYHGNGIYNFLPSTSTQPCIVLTLQSLEVGSNYYTWQCVHPCVCLCVCVVGCVLYIVKNNLKHYLFSI